MLADKRIVAVATTSELERSDHPWIKEYFLGVRGRAANRNEGGPGMKSRTAKRAMTTGQAPAGAGTES